MEVIKTIELSVKDKKYIIPSDFHYFNDIDQNIYTELITHQKYHVTSNISDDVFQSFINYWINKEIPYINFSNYYEYYQLSREFDIMKDLLELYKMHYLRSSVPSLMIQNQELKKQNQEKKNTLDSTIDKYKQIINFLFRNNGIALQSRSPKEIDILYRECNEGNIKYVDLLTQEKFKENGFIYILNEKSGTAEIFRNVQASKNIVLRSSISNNSKEYKITSIGQNSFYYSNRVKSVKFEEDSELKTIGYKAFYLSSIEKINIPSHVTHILNNAFDYCSKLKKVKFSENSELTSIGEFAFSNSSIEKLIIPSSISEFKVGWCNRTPNLTEIKIFFNKIQNIQYFEDKFIIGKTDIKSDTFDILLFVRRNVETVTIPSFIKRISSFAFDNCARLTTVNFLNDSNLQYIDKYAFSSTSIVNISIPKHVIQIDETAFCFCDKLVKIEFHENCELKTIGRCAFYRTSFESFTIPSSLVELKDGWCASTHLLNNVKIMPNNEHFKYYKNDFILGELLPFSNIFDVLLFARKNIKKVVIPSFIKRIAPYSFNNCDCIQKVEFELDSQLDSIGEQAFSYGSLKSISIPSHLKKIENSAFTPCHCLNQIQIRDDAELVSISEFAFAFSSIYCFFFSSKLIRIGKKAFFGCKNLLIFEFDENSKLISININIFGDSGLRIIMIPIKLAKRIKFIYS